MTSYNRYSHHAQRALTRADLLAERYHQPVADTAHLLVGMLLTEGCIAYQVLQTLPLTADQAEPLLPSLYPEAQTTTEELMQASLAEMEVVLQLAADESTWLGQHYIGTEHLLLGITRTNAGQASALFRLLDIKPETVRRHVRKAISDGLTEFNLQRARRDARLSELSRRVLNATQAMSVTLDHQTVGLGHLLLVLLLEKRSQTSSLLRECGLDETRLRQGLKQRDPTLLVSVESVLEQATEAAEMLGDHYTGTDHLLLMLTIDPTGVALLRRYGLEPHIIRTRLQAQLGGKLK